MFGPACARAFVQYSFPLEIERLPGSGRLFGVQALACVLDSHASKLKLELQTHPHSKGGALHNKVTGVCLYQATSFHDRACPSVYPQACRRRASRDLAGRRRPSVWVSCP